MSRGDFKKSWNNVAVAFMRRRNFQRRQTCLPGCRWLSPVLEGLKGNCGVSELYNTHGITQGMYYKWRDRLLTDGAELFECGGVDHARERLKQENRKLRKSSKNAWFSMHHLYRLIQEKIIKMNWLFCFYLLSYVYRIFKEIQWRRFFCFYLRLWASASWRAAGSGKCRRRRFRRKVKRFAWKCLSLKESFLKSASEIVPMQTLDKTLGHYFWFNSSWSKPYRF